MRTAPAVVLAAFLVGTAASPAAAAPGGTLTFSPARGDAGSAITVTTSARCPAGTNVLARIYGAGFPGDGQVAVANTPISALSAGVTGYAVPLAMSVRDLLNLQKAPHPPAGAYRIVLTCRTAFQPRSLGEFTGTLTFAGTGGYTAPATPRAGAAGPGGPGAGGATDRGVPPCGGQGPGGAGSGAPTGPAQVAATNAAQTHSRSFGDSGTDFVTLGLLLVALVGGFFGGMTYLRRRRGARA